MQELEAPGTGAKPALYAAMADAIGTISCSQYYEMMRHPLKAQGDPKACGGAGTLANGKQCFVDSQCVSGTCVVADTAACGVCGGEVGAACSSSSECQEANTCDFNTQKCIARSQVGGACTYDTHCVEALYCDSTDHCVVRRPEGAACETTSECAAGMICGIGKTCKEPSLGSQGASCTDETFSCNMYLGLTCEGGFCVKSDVLNVGDACGAFKLDGSTEYKFSCVGGSGCAIPQGEQTGVCIVDAQDGQACDAQHGASCIQPAKCVNNICTLVTAATCPAN
jgi:hypothetical protein